ncbi:MAG TPA: hypothetical protein VEC38_05415 [Candidatus Binataceae bacterium]|nr:hypothetical protein [Candidatus Binataceae bacterium]
MALLILAAALLLIGASPGIGWACACGCGVFEVGTSSLFPQGSGGQVWLQYEYLDQYINWHATQPASATQNNDKYIRTNFMEAGLQYMFNRSFGVMLEVPYWVRNYKGAYVGNNEDIHWFQNNSIGDIRIQGMYTGLSEDMSTGLLMGVKVPSGDWTYPPLDRDTEIGSGSTDLLMGAYHLGTFPARLGTIPLTFRDRPISWYVQVNYNLPLWGQEHYTPGREVDGAVGTYYDFGKTGPLSELAPMVTFLASDRTRDTGANASPADSGYTRLLIAPGGEIKLGVIRAYADIEVPIFQNVRGYQLTAPFATKLILSYSF